MKSKALLYLCLGILCLAPAALHAQASVSTLVAVEENGPRSRQLNFVYLSDGFTTAEMGTFAAEVDRAVDYLFAREPWSRYRRFCNVYRIEVPSAESGTSDPDNNVKRNTYFQSYYWPGIDRLTVLSGDGEKRAFSIMNAFVPEYDVPVVIVNTTRYGGSGGPIAVATRNEWGPGLVEHETGHSFAGLGDEYQTPTPGYSQFEWPNTTQQADIAKVRWKIWVEPGTPSKTPEDDPLWAAKVGHFEGANYRDTGQFRAHDRSIMQILSAPNIGQVNREAFVLGMYKRVQLVNEFSPTALTQTHTSPQNLVFSVSPKIVSEGPPITVEWKLNGSTLAGETGNTLTRSSKLFGNGKHTLKAIVRDPTDWIRKDMTPLTKEITWTLNLSNQVAAPVITNNLPASRQLALGGSSIVLDGTATGEGTITYQWLKNNAPLKPPVTTPTLTITPFFLADAGTYSVKVNNTGPIVTQSCVVTVVDPEPPRVVVGKGKNATLTFLTSPKPPACQWTFGEGLLSNGGRYSNATTNALQIKGVTEEDTGDYYFTCGTYSAPQPAKLQVVTDKPDYTGVALRLEPGWVGGNYKMPFPLPQNLLRLPNSFSASKLPAGLKMEPKTGMIYGRPTTPTKDQTEGDEVIFTVGNEFGKVVLKIPMLILPLPVSVAGVYSGYVPQNSVLGGPTGGRIDISVLSTGTYSGKAIVGTETLSFSGQISVPNEEYSTAYGHFLVKPKHLAGATTDVEFEIDGLDDGDPLTAMLTSSGNFVSWRNKWLPPENADVFKGYHTFAFTAPGGSAASVPKGHGFGSVSIDANGKTVVAGKLADGESFTSSSHASHEGGVLVYQALYTTLTKGSLVAVLDLDPDEGDVTAVFTNKTFTQWTRPLDTRGTTRVYRQGFGPLDLDAFGGLYTPPAKTEIVMGLPAASGSPPANAWISFAQTLGEDPLAVDADVSLEIKAGGSAKVPAPNPKVVTFVVTPADGRFKGGYTTKDDDPRPPLAPNKPRPQISRKGDYQGIILWDGSALLGYGFLLRDSLPKADGSDTPTTSPRCSGWVLLDQLQ